jgi:hypothetical protein
MKPVVVELEIERLADVVWEYMENAEHNPEWLSNMRSARWTTEPPIAVGSRYDQMARFLRKDVRTSFEVTDSSGFYRLAEPLMRPLVRRNIARAYRRLKQLLES